MSRRFTILSTIILLGGSIVVSPQSARAEIPLTRGVVQSLRNIVQLVARNQSPRPARVRDTLTPGDSLSTARASLAELRFNDGSLARIGEQAIFRFAPRTRTFQLSNGTVLLLIPPGRGQTRVRTPNALAGIRGSALFIRYIPETDVTVVGALTNSDIQVSNRDSSQSQVLKAGQLAVLIKDRIERVYDFDLNTFYGTSDLVSGLDLQRRAGKSLDAEIAAVQAETAEAVTNQPQLSSVSEGAISEIQNSTLLRRPGDAAVAPPAAAVTPSAATPIQLPNAINPAAISLPDQFGLPVIDSTITLPGAGAILGRDRDVGPGRPGNNSGGNGPRGNGPGGNGPPGQTGQNPGQGGGGPPGQTGNNPGQGGGGPPGQTGNNPGQGGGGPPGQGAGPPGAGGNGPGGNGPPGQTGQNPGQGGGGPPGQTGNNPGQGGGRPLETVTDRQ